MLRYSEYDLSPWRLLDELMGVTRAGTGTGGVLTLSGRYPRVNAWENDNGLILEAEMPGATPESVEVAVEGSELTLKGTRPVHGEGKGQPFERRFDLPFDVDSGAVQAKFRNGMLTLALPKAASARRRQIAVQAA